MNLHVSGAGGAHQPSSLGILPKATLDEIKGELRAIYVLGDDILKGPVDYGKFDALNKLCSDLKDKIYALEDNRPVQEKKLIAELAGAVQAYGSDVSELCIVQNDRNYPPDFVNQVKGLKDDALTKIQNNLQALGE